MNTIPVQQSGWPIVGNDRSVEMLRRALRTGNLPHSYLFAGVEGTGKHALAIAFAMTLNCLGDYPEGQPWPDTPCLICPSCSRMLRGAHPDLIQINLETQAQALGESSARAKTGPAKELKIDVIREMQETVGLSPHSGRWKVYVIGDAERLNEEASNCLLKTLEEPPAHTIIILLAPDESALLPTIASRCFMVPVRPVPVQVEADALEVYWGAEREQATTLAALSGGRLGYAVGLLEDKEGLNRRRKGLEEISVLSGAPIAERVNAAAKWAKLFTDARPELYEMLDTWEGWWRDVLLVSASAPELVGNVDHVSTLSSLARKNNPTRAASAVILIREARQQLLENVNPRLALEALALALP